MAGVIYSSAGANNGCTVLFSNGFGQLYFLSMHDNHGCISYITGHSNHGPGSVEH